jgi:hypothetical protein
MKLKKREKWDKKEHENCMEQKSEKIRRQTIPSLAGTSRAKMTHKTLVFTSRKAQFCF